MGSQFAEALSQIKTTHGPRAWMERVGDHLDEKSMADLEAALNNPQVSARAIWRTLQGMDIGYKPAYSSVRDSVAQRRGEV